MFASRAGQKLEHGLEAFQIDVKEKICADLGCSTGGFTDCLLQHGAKKVYAVDTGYGVLDWKLRNDPRVVVMERTNALHVSFPESPDLITIDLGWTRQRNILPYAVKLLAPHGDIISLFKPQYEEGREWLKLNDEEKDRRAEHSMESLQRDLIAEGINLKERIVSPIVGEKGKNKEYLLWIQKI